MTTDSERSSFFIALVVVDVLVGLADAMSGPYVVLFLVDHARLEPLPLSAILTVRALTGIAFGTAFGAWVDRRTTVLPLLIALAGSSMGYALLGFTTEFTALLLTAGIPVAVGAAVFSQSIALVKHEFQDASFRTANRAIGVLRASWSLAWAIGPAVGAVAVETFGFRGAFLTSAVSSLIALVVLAVVRAKPAPGGTRVDRRTSGNDGPSIALAFSGLALFYTAMFLGSIALPVVLTTALGGTRSDVGLTMSLCAALEIVVMGALIWRPLANSGVRMAIAAGFLAFLAYFVAIALARSVGLVFWAQVLRAIGIALVTYLGIGFLQSLMPHRPGAAAALFSNAGQVGLVAASLGVGALAHAFGYGSIFIACAILSARGLALVGLVRAEPD